MIGIQVDVVSSVSEETLVSIVIVLEDVRWEEVSIWSSFKDY